MRIDMALNRYMELTEKQETYQHCYSEKQINMNILQVKKYYLRSTEK